MNVASDDKALFSVAKKVLLAVGAKANQTCLDFGCGHGNYTIPLAHVVGPAGKVYALDKDKQALERLGERGRAAGLANIETVVWSDESRLPFGDRSLDLVLLYDVLHGHYFSTDRRASLFREVGRVSKAGALLSVFPRHMADDEVAGEVVRRAASAGFEAQAEYQGPVVHDDTVTGGHIITFRKTGAQRRPFPPLAGRRFPTRSPRKEGSTRRSRWGVGPQIGLLTAAWAALALIVHWVWYPTFAVAGGLRSAFQACGLGMLGVGIPVYVALAVWFARASRRGALVTTGPYARVRHPVYAVWVFLLVPGAALLAGSWLLLSVPPVMYLAARVFIPAEEKKLENRYGNLFQEYRRRTGRLVPRVGPRGLRGKQAA